MIVNRAYEYVIMEAIKTVGDICQRIEILPSKRTILTLGKLPKQKYVKIYFYSCHNERINELENQIAKKRIYFDITRQNDFRSWSLDWSFVVLNSRIGLFFRLNQI